jgi:hypothetical protein
MPQQAQFDVNAARQSGATDDQILSYLSQRSPNFDVQGALRQSSKGDVISYLATHAAPPTAGAQLQQSQPQQSFGDKLTAGYDPGAAEFDEKHPIIGKPVRYASALGGAVLGIPSALYHAASDPITEDEKKKFGSDEDPNASWYKPNMSNIGPTGRAIVRMVGEPIENAVSTYANPQTRPTAKQAMSVLPEALGQGSGAYVGSDLLSKGVDAVTKPLAPLLEKSANTQYMKALSPTKARNKVIAQRITPELLRRGVSGSLESISDQASSALDDIGPQIDAAVNKPTRAPQPRIAGLLRAAPTDIPLGDAPSPPKMPGGLFPARPMPRSNVVGGTPPEELASQLGSTANTVPARIYRQGYMTGSNESVGEVPELSGPGVLRTRDPAIANRFTEAPKQPYTIPQAKQLNVQPVLDSLESYKQQGVVNGVKVDQDLVRQATQLQRVVEQLGPNVSYASLNRVRQIWDAKVAKAGGYAGTTLAEGSKVDAMREGANAIRDELAKNRPDIAKLNAEYSFWSKVQQVTGDTIQRRSGQEGALMPKLAGIGGAATGHTPMGAVMYALGKVIQSPRWRTFSAVKKTQIANAISAGDVATVTKLAGLGASTYGAQQ